MTVLSVPIIAVHKVSLDRQLVHMMVLLLQGKPMTVYRSACWMGMSTLTGSSHTRSGSWTVATHWSQM